MSPETNFRDGANGQHFFQASALEGAGVFRLDRMLDLYRRNGI